MSKPIPAVKQYMSISPHTIGAEQTLKQANTLLGQYEIRHLPVLHGGKLVGVLTDRDLKLVQSLEGVDLSVLRVEDAMSQEVYSVSPEAPLDEVAGEMAAHKYGSAVVLQNGKVVGIFTTVDACKSLEGLLRGRLEK